MITRPMQLKLSFWITINTEPDFINKTKVFGGKGHIQMALSARRTAEKNDSNAVSSQSLWWRRRRRRRRRKLLTGPSGDITQIAARHASANAKENANYNDFRNEEGSIKAALFQVISFHNIRFYAWKKTAYLSVFFTRFILFLTFLWVKITKLVYIITIFRTQLNFLR